MRLKIFILLSFLIMSFLPVSAQLGFKAGIGVSDIIFNELGQSPYLGYEVDYYEHNKPALTWQAGAFATFRYDKRLDFQPELLFIQQGFNYNIDFIYSDVIYKLNIYYLQVPVLVRYKFMKDKNWHPGLYAGPYGSLKLKAVMVTGENGEKTKEDMANDKSGDFGLAFGLNFDIDMSSGQLVVDLRSSYSLINMMNPIDGFIPDYYGPENEKARNISITLMVGYRFNNLWSKTKNINE